MKLMWIYKRLKAMSLKEIRWRIQEKLRRSELKLVGKKIIDKNLFGVINENTEELKEYTQRFYQKFDCRFKNEFIINHTEFYHRTLQKADQISYGNYCLLGRYYIDFEILNNWGFGFPLQGNWPMKYSPKIDFRESIGIGDVRYTWDLNRHYLLTILAKAYYLNENEKYIIELKKLFYDWVERNQFLFGINWTSSMEIAIRSYSWIWCIGLLGEMNNSNLVSFLKDLRVAIINQIHYITQHFSCYSSANNHLIIEATIVGIAGIIFNKLSWINQAIHILNNEIKRQIHQDGIDKEQSTHYHCFVMEGLFLFIKLLQKNKINYPPTWHLVLKKMCQFLSDIMDIEGNLPHIGDCDEGVVLNLLGEAFNYAEYILQMGSELFDTQYIQMEQINENIFWLFQMSDLKKELKHCYETKQSVCYPEGGYTILKYYKKSKGERILTFDHGDLGFDALAAHGHADTLGITLSVDTVPIIIDPGTYTYNIKKYWRDYFRKTMNHSTITINCKDQSEMLGAFLWGKKARSKLIQYVSVDDEVRISAMHDGYAPLYHARTIEYKKPDEFIIIDQIYGGACKWTLTYMLAPDLTIKKLEKNKIVSQSKSNNIFFVLEDEREWIIDKEWVSPFFGEKIPTNALRCHGICMHKVDVRTHIIISNKA